MKVLMADGNPGTSTRLDSGARLVTIAGAGIAVVMFGAAAALGGWESFLRSYLVSFAWSLSIALGALFFVLIQHVTGATWSIVVRRIAEATAVNVLLLAILFVPVVAGLNVLYEWAHAAGAHSLGAKAAWYGKGFFVIRAAVYFGIWILMARSFYRNSVAQDSSGDRMLTVKMRRRAPLAMVLYGITVTFAAFDLLMSLDPHWYSTIFGVYYYSGAVVGFFAFLTIAVFLLQRSGKLRDEITLEHYHDLGKQLFGWIVFWAYIAFSQYMLIWYTNIPEETTFFLARQTGGWATVSLILLFGHFAIPFLLLMPRGIKRRPPLLAGMAAFVLVMHWIDMYWLVAPEKGAAAGHVPFGAQDVACFLGHLALFVAGVTFTLGSGSLLPEKDPGLADSLAFENA